MVQLLDDFKISGVNGSRILFMEQALWAELLSIRAYTVDSVIAVGGEKLSLWSIYDPQQICNKNLPLLLGL